jgi:hypothetical protein
LYFKTQMIGDLKKEKANANKSLMIMATDIANK